VARITFSLDESLAAAADKVAEGEKRSLSSYISLLVERDLDSRGKLPGSPAERTLAKARTAIETCGEAAVEQQLDELLNGVATDRGISATKPASWYR
jgi:hypothetical protein